MECVQCKKPMDVWAYFAPIKTEDSVISNPAYYCDKPECPNFNLLQGDLTQQS